MSRPTPSLHAAHAPHPFATLLRREWLQHRVGWAVMLVAPAVLLFVAGLFPGSLQLSVQLDDATHEQKVLSLAHAAPLMQAAIGGLAALVLGYAMSIIALMVTLFVLARHDRGDRSIAFWRALPVSDVSAVAAPLLAHALLLPLAALAVDMVAAVLLTMGLVMPQHGVAAWLALPGSDLLWSGLALVLRLAVGLVLALAWAAPLLLGTMVAVAANARMGFPALVGVLAAGVVLVDPRLPSPLLGPALLTLRNESFAALGAVRPLGGLKTMLEDPGALAMLPAALVDDTARVLSDAATPGLLLSLALGGAFFAALVWLRRRHD